MAGRYLKLHKRLGKGSLKWWWHKCTCILFDKDLSVINLFFKRGLNENTVSKIAGGIVFYLPYLRLIQLYALRSFPIRTNMSELTFRLCPVYKIVPDTLLNTFFIMSQVNLNKKNWVIINEQRFKRSTSIWCQDFKYQNSNDNIFLKPFILISFKRKSLTHYNLPLDMYFDMFVVP